MLGRAAVPRVLSPAVLALVVALGTSRGGFGQDIVSTHGARAPRTNGYPSKPAPIPPSLRLFAGPPDPSAERAVAPPDVARLLSEDEARAASGEKCLRVGVEIPLDPVEPDGGGWIPDGSGGRFWSMQVLVPGSRATRVHFTQFTVPRGGEVFVYSPDEIETVWGPFAGTGIDETGAFWSPSTEGERVIIEYHEPKPSRPESTKVPFRVAGVMYCYRHPLDPGTRSGAGPCELDATCFPAWANVGDAVGRLFFVDGGSGFVCTGVLLNAQNDDRTPYLLTANHCIPNNTVAATLDAAWFFESAVCNGPAPSVGSVPHSTGATFIAGRSRAALSDFTLLMINGALPGGLFWAGWTNGNPPAGSSATAIHHPSGSYRRIAFGTTRANCTANFHCVRWGSGITEPGSSGSPLYNASQQVIGQLWGGSSSCANPVGPDEFGRLAASYPLISSALAGGSDDALEENDSCATPSILGAGAFANLVVKSTDRDWYRIDVPSGQRLTARLSFTHANGDIDCALYDACGGAALATATGAANDETVAFENTSGATVTTLLEAYLFSDTRNEYAMTLTIAACVGDDAFEGNDACAAASPVADGTYPGLLVVRTDEDWYRVTVPGFSSLTVTTTFSGAVADVDMGLFLFCGGGAISTSTGIGDSEAVTATNVNPTPADHLVRVYVFSGSPGECTTYSMTVVTTPCASDDSREPNDSCAEASTVSNGTIVGLLSRSGDDDWYRINVQGGARLELSLSFVNARGDIDLELYDACGGTLVASSTGMGDGESVSLRNRTTATQAFFARAFLFSGECNIYSIAASRIPNTPPTAPQPPTGRARAVETESVFFTAGTTDPEGDAITYTFDWADGTTTTSASVPSGTPVSLEHAYSAEGIYGVRVRATDSFGNPSALSPGAPIDVADADCRLGNVGLDDGGGAVDVLRVNGSTGSGPARRVVADKDLPIDIALDAATAGPPTPDFAVWVWLANPSSSTDRNLPYALGRMCMNPIRASCGAACPVIAANTFGRCAAVLCSTPEATGARPPGVVIAIPGGRFAAGESLYVQGVMQDLSDTTTRRISVTNGVEVNLAD